jgi:hypothetical protein
MSKASNPTRPTASSAEVGRRLSGLSAPQRRRLTDSGYSIESLRRVSEIEEQADAVDALLAIFLDRQGYTHDQADLKAATKVAHTLNAKVDPKSWLIYRKKEQSTQFGGFADPGRIRRSRVSGWVYGAVVGGIVLAILLLALVVTLAK